MTKVCIRGKVEVAKLGEDVAKTETVYTFVCRNFLI